MNRFVVRALGAVAGGLLAVGFSPAGLAFAGGDADGGVPVPGAPAVVATSNATSVNAQPAPAPAAAAVAIGAVPSPGGCHMVWANIFGPVCMPGR